MPDEREEIEKLRETLRGVESLLQECYEHWDADQDSKVGKILCALTGALPKYDKRADAFRVVVRGGKAL